jgi:hypothetical protein
MALRAQVPFRQLRGVRITDVEDMPDQPYDVRFQIELGDSRIPVFGEIKANLSPKTAEEIAPWIARLKAIRPDSAFVVISPYLTQQTQDFCIENGIDFIDLTGNVSINMPGKIVLRRLGMKGKKLRSSPQPMGIVGVYSGRSSRVLRVLLQKPGAWSLTKIADELAAETQRNPFAGAGSFQISLGSISKVLATLEEELVIRRRNSTILVPEPRRLLIRWAEKYRERYRWRLRSAFTCPNPFGNQPREISKGLDSTAAGNYALTGAAAASIDAPFVDIDSVEVFIADRDRGAAFRQLKDRTSTGVKLRFIYPYDFGVFMYARIVEGVPVVADVQMYLDLYARGGRDLKQAEYLLEKRIVPTWSQG